MKFKVTGRNDVTDKKRITLKSCGIWRRIYSTVLLTTSLLRHGFMAQGGEARLRHLFAIAEQLPMPPLIVKRLSRHKRSVDGYPRKTIA
jgi:hypothetical protein